MVATECVLIVNESIMAMSCMHQGLLGIHTKDCEGWWSSDCCGSVAEHWRLKPEVLGSTPGDCRPFHFLLLLPHNIIYYRATQASI